MKHIKEYDEFINEAYDKRAYDSFTKYLQKNAASANLELFDPIPVGGSIFNKDYEKADNVLSFDWNIIDGKYTGSVKQKIDNFFKKAAAKFNMKPIHIQVGSVEFAPAVNEGKDNTVESVNEGKYKLGDKYSSDFDYDGMLRMGANATIDMGLGALQKLYNSFEDVNYHSENKWLGYAIEELEDGFKKKAEKWLKKFNDACKKELNESTTSDKKGSLFDRIKPQERWWENDPEDLMAYLYWLKRSLPPVDPRKKKREWLKIMDQLAAKHKAPYKDFSRLAKHKFD